MRYKLYTVGADFKPVFLFLFLSIMCLSKVIVPEGGIVEGVNITLFFLGLAVFLFSIYETREAPLDLREKVMEYSGVNPYVDYALVYCRNANRHPVAIYRAILRKI